MITTGDIAATRRRLGQRIRALRNERDISQSKFAKMIGMDRTYLVGVEYGRRNVSINNIVKIAAGLGVTLSDLFDDVYIIEVQKDHIETIKW